MPENFEQPKPISQEHTPEAEGTLELIELKPEEKVFLDTIVTSIYRNRNKSEVGQGYLNPNIVRSIAEINLETALRIVRQEERPRVEILAQLATLAKERPDSGVDFESLVASIETFANKTHENDYTHKQDFDYYPTSIAKAAIALRESAPDVSDKLLQLALDNATADQSGDGLSWVYGFIAKCHMVEDYARVNPEKAEELLREFKVTKDESDTKPIIVTIEKYLEHGDIESAYRVAIERGDVGHIVVAGAEIAKIDPQRLIEAITDKWVTKKEKYSQTSPERAVEVYEQLANSLFRSGHAEIAQRLLGEAKTVAEAQGDRGVRQLVKVVSHSDPESAIGLIQEKFNDKNDQYAIVRNRLINDVSIRTALHDPDRAKEIYQQSKHDSLGKQDALVTLALEYQRQGNSAGAKSVIDELKTNISESGEYDTEWQMSFDNLYKLSEYFPELALEILEGKKGSLPELHDQAGIVGAKRLFAIFDKNNLSVDEKQNLIVQLGKRYSFDSERSVLESALLDQISEKSAKLLSEEGMVSYFQSLDPENENDIATLKNLATTGLIPEHKIEDLLQKGDAQSLNLSSLLLSAEVYKKTDFDIASFDRLMALAQSENQSVRQAALHGIKLLQPKVAELFYSSNQQYQDTLKKLYGLSPEAQQWFSDLDEHIAENFDTQNLIRLVTKLGQEEALQMFPQAMTKAREEILAHLPSNEDLADYFLENLHLYYTQSWATKGVEGAVKHFPVAQKFIKAVDAGVSPWKDASWVANVYAKAKLTKPHDEEEWDEERGAETQGFSETDPYENHRWKFTGEQIKIASALSDIIAGKTNEQDIKELGLSAESQKILKTVEQSLETAYENFISEIQASTTFPEEDKNALLHSENSSVRMTNLQDNIRSFVARYLTQMAEGDVAKLNKELANISENLEGILQEGFRRFIKIHEVDVPLYDKLYEEFDNLRETGQYPLEVYLGRDGIYAWLGRRAQDVARRRKLGLERRKQLKEAGEVVEIKPKYLTYPRYFRDSINYETKREFLEQEGISPNADPMFYDTGYTGTIPEQIMRVMDFENEEIERRIRLLSAPVMHRRVKGIPENARAEIIEYIEHNAKTEDTAVGLVKDPKTGKIRHIAEPTAPDEQFYFMMVKQAVGRHYWLKEQLHHESSGNINLDSEHYLIRIRQEYSSFLPPEFVSDPKTYLAQHGELMKGSKGEGEYPDEEVVLFKLTNDTEIVAKRVELRKAKEARKEFSILIAARKANLPTAEPVGFLSGKTESDSSYLLMKKLEGFSGRKFEKHLRDSGKYDDNQVKAIMQTVAEKNKDMAELFRETLNIDKRWRIKDTIIEFDEETGEVAGVIPIDWERIQNYDPESPKEIDEIT